MRIIQRGLVWTCAGMLAGCGTTRMTDTQRTATEQLLVSNAVDQAVSQLDFRALAGKPVFFDPQYLDGVVDRGYLVSSLRQHLLASGCLLQEERPKADYVVEARSGSVGTNRSSLLVGVPQMNVPAIVPGQPSFIPEIPLAKKTDQEGVAKVAVFAYNRKTGQPLWQSGIVQSNSNSKDTWVLGAGPFQQGTIRRGTEFAGEPLPIPRFGSRDDGTPSIVSTKVRVTEPAVWSETAVDHLTFLASTGPIMEPMNAVQPSTIAPMGTWTSESKLERGTPWNLIKASETHSTSAISAPPPFTPPPASTPPTSPKPATPSPTNIGGQAETEPNKVDASGMSISQPTNPSGAIPSDGGVGSTQSIDASSWYAAISRRTFR